VLLHTASYYRRDHCNSDLGARQKVNVKSRVIDDFSIFYIIFKITSSLY